jgi:hypothetical protein
MRLRAPCHGLQSGSDTAVQESRVYLQSNSFVAVRRFCNGLRAIHSTGTNATYINIISMILGRSDNASNHHHYAIGLRVPGAGRIVSAWTSKKYECAVSCCKSQSASNRIKVPNIPWVQQG